MRFRSKINAAYLILFLPLAVMLLTGCPPPSAQPLSINDAAFPNGAARIFAAPGKEFDAAEKAIRRFLEDEKYQNAEQEQRVLQNDLSEQDFLKFYDDQTRMINFQPLTNFNLTSENATLRAWEKNDGSHRQIMIAALIKPRGEPQKPMILIFLARK